MAILLAQRQLTAVAGANTEPMLLVAAADVAYTALRKRLTALIGRDGYAALLNRSLRLAQTGHPALGAVSLDAQSETGLHGIYDFAGAHANTGEAAEALSSVLAHIISLLVVFIGEDITVGLVYDAWPELAVETAERRSEHG